MWFALASHNRIVLPGEAEGVHNDAFVLRLCGLRCYPQPELSWSQAYSGHPRTHGPLCTIIGMYGPSQNCKRKTRMDRWSAPMYSALWSENSWP